MRLGQLWTDINRTLSQVGTASTNYQNKETVTVRVLEKDIESIIKDLDVCRIGMITGKRENTIWELRDLLKRVNQAHEDDYAISDTLRSTILEWTSVLLEDKATAEAERRSRRLPPKPKLPKFPILPPK